MTNILEEAKLGLQKDFLSPSHQWDFLQTLLEKSDTDRLPLLLWVFEESPAYWDTRAQVGMLLLQENELEIWLTIRRLVASTDPDDNGTALTIFERTGDPRGLELAQDWLREGVHPATQIEAINFLKKVYPEKVWARVQALCNHDDPNIRRTAKRLADELKAG